MRVLAFDPSGNHAEGNGTTGWALFVDGELKAFGEVKASEFLHAEAYWHSAVALINGLEADAVVYETYRLRAGKAMEQSWSQLETPQLIGIIRWYCWSKNIHCFGQDPTLKERFKDSVLVATNYAEKRPGGLYIDGKRTNMHMRDAIRHGLYFHRYGKGKELVSNGR